MLVTCAREPVLRRRHSLFAPDVVDRDPLVYTPRFLTALDSCVYFPNGREGVVERRVERAICRSVATEYLLNANERSTWPRIARVTVRLGPLDR